MQKMDFINIQGYNEFINAVNKEEVILCPINNNNTGYTIVLQKLGNINFIDFYCNIQNNYQEVKRCSNNFPTIALKELYENMLSKKSCFIVKSNEKINFDNFMMIAEIYYKYLYGNIKFK
jgi:hypothetical protein